MHSQIFLLSLQCNKNIAMRKLKSIYDVKFSSSEEFYWFDENCLRESNDTFRKIFPNSRVTDEELDFFREEIMLA